MSENSLLPLTPLLGAIGEPTRWQILAALSLAGEPLMVKEIAERIGRSPSLVSKHIAILRRAGAVVSGRAQLYSIPAAYVKEKGVIDYGYFLLRLGTPAS